MEVDSIGNEPMNAQKTKGAHAHFFALLRQIFFNQSKWEQFFKLNLLWMSSL
jgi:hypothetical protein